MVEDPLAVEPLKAIVDAETAPPLLRYHTATALGILLRRLNTKE